MVASSSMDDLLRDVRMTVRARALMRELATLTGVSEADAVLIALEERVARLKGPVSREERIGRALATLRATTRPTGGRTVPERRERDRALGYGEEGV